MPDRGNHNPVCIDQREQVVRRGLERPSPPAMTEWQALVRRSRYALAANSALALNAGSVALAKIANGALGFVYWWVVARSFSPTAVGLASADISLILLLSLVAEVGLGTLLQGEIPRRQRRALHLVSAALLASLASAGIFGLAYLVFATVFASGFEAIGGAPLTRLFVVVGICVETTSLVLDAALIGMLQAQLRLYRNLMFAVVKLLFVISAAALMISDRWQLNAIIASWVVGQCLASLALASAFSLRGARIWYRPSFDLLGRLVGVAFWHHAINVVATAPSLILPVIIPIVLSPAQNAPFYAAWMLLSLAGVVPWALATVLFTVGSSGSSTPISSIRFSLRVSLGIGFVMALGFWLLSNVVLGILNPVYLDLVGLDLRFLGLSIPLMAVKVHYMTLQRLEGRLRTAAFTLLAFGVIEVLFAILGAELNGLSGAIGGWLLAIGIEASCLWRTIRRRLSREGTALVRSPKVVGRRVA